MKFRSSFSLFFELELFEFIKGNHRIFQKKNKKYTWDLEKEVIKVEKVENSKKWKLTALLKSSVLWSDSFEKSIDLRIFLFFREIFSKSKRIGLGPRQTYLYFKTDVYFYFLYGAIARIIKKIWDYIIKLWLITMERLFVPIICAKSPTR